MSKAKKRVEYSRRATDLDFAKMTDQQILDYARANPYQVVSTTKTISEQGFKILARRWGEALYLSLPTEQRMKMAREVESGLEPLKVIQRRYFPDWPQFI